MTRFPSGPPSASSSSDCRRRSRSSIPTLQLLPPGQTTGRQEWLPKGQSPRRHHPNDEPGQPGLVPYATTRSRTRSPRVSHRRRLLLLAALAGPLAIGSGSLLGGWVGGVGRSAADPEASATTAAARARAADPGSPRVRAGRAGDRRWPPSTVWKMLRRHGASRLRQPAREPVRRYERERPGELVHVDIKKAGPLLDRRQADPRGRPDPQPPRRLAVPPPRDRTTDASPTPSCSPARPPTASRSSAAPAAGTPSRASRSSACSQTRVLSDNGNDYRANAWAAACEELSIGRRHTRPRRPRPTAKPKRSSRHCSANGNTASPIPQRPPRPSAPRLHPLVQPRGE